MKQYKRQWNSIFSNQYLNDKLNDLYDKAKDAEIELNERCKKILENNGETFYTSMTGHGDYIRAMHGKIFRQTSDFRYPSIGQSNFKSKELDAYTDEIYDLLRETMNTKAFQDSAIEYLIDNFKKSTKADDRIGLYSEINTFKYFVNGLNHIFPDNYTIVDTEKDPYGDGLFYDIMISITNDEGKSLIDLPYENKASLDSPFHFGDFSSSAFVNNIEKKTYNGLIDVLQASFQDFVLKGSTDKIDEWIQQTIVEWAADYIDWKISHNFPIFISDRGQYKLSTDIIAGFLGYIGGTVEVDIEDLLRVVDLDQTSRRKSKDTRYTRSSPDYDSKVTHEKYDYKTKMWQTRGIYDAKLSIDKVRISPLFKAKVWYGQH